MPLGFDQRLFNRGSEGKPQFKTGSPARADLCDAGGIFMRSTFVVTVINIREQHFAAETPHTYALFVELEHG